VRAARQVGLEAELYGQTGLAQPAFLHVAGPAANGTHFLVAIDPTDPTPAQQKLFGLLERHGVKPTGAFGELVYASAMRTLAAALEKTGGDGGEALQDALDSGVEAESYWRTPLTFREGQHDGLPASAFRWAVANDGAFDLTEQEGK
jgi:ABC-type branched-subunit amino acid transport system substrate-binding protein